MGDRTKIADALTVIAADRAAKRMRSQPDALDVAAARNTLAALDAAGYDVPLRADPDTSDEHKPCPHCNDEGVVCTLDGEIIGPCDCTSDDLLTEARRLLDAATPGPWEVNRFECEIARPSETDDFPTLIASYFSRDDAIQAEADAELIAAAPRLIAALLERAVTAEADPDWFSGYQTVMAERDKALAERDADVSAGAVARTVAMSHIAAERDAERAARERAEAEARQLREAIRAHENLHRPDGPDGADGPIEMDGWPCCNDDRLLWAAAVAEVAEDRGQTDG